MKQIHRDLIDLFLVTNQGSSKETFKHLLEIYLMEHYENMNTTISYVGMGTKKPEEKQVIINLSIESWYSSHGRVIKKLRDLYHQNKGVTIDFMIRDHGDSKRPMAYPIKARIDIKYI